MTPLVSVIVPAWRENEYAEATLQSVYDQDCEAVEIIVVDDRSHSRSTSAARGFLERERVRPRFRRIEFVEAPAETSVPQAINRGLQECRGDYINVLEAGDALAARRFSRLLTTCADTGAELAFSRVELLGDAPARWSGEGLSMYSVQDDIEFFPTVGYALLSSQCAVSSGNLFFSRRLPERVGGFREHDSGRGWDFALRCVLVTEPVFVPEPLYLYRLHGRGNLTERRNQPAGETESVLKTYLFLCRNRPVENPLAPSPAWGPFFYSFVEASGYGKYLSKP
jgi:glycosyltransferase involved in cell wall biosynthesis